MEALQIQKIGSVAIEPVLLNDLLDKNFKPGIYRQTEDFLSEKYDQFCSIKEQQQLIHDFYLRMSAYKIEQDWNVCFLFHR